MREATRQRSGQTLDVEPIGPAGLDLNSNPALVGPDKLVTGRNIVQWQDAVERRKGSAKVSYFADPTDAYGAKTLGTSDAKYARFTPPLFPKGGLWIKYAFVAKRPASGVRYVLSSWTAAAQAHAVVWSTVSSAGVVVVKVEWESGGVTTLTTSAQAADAELTALLVYDPVAGTLTLYIDGAQAAQATGLSADLQPRQDAGVAWYLGLSYKPGTGPDADSGLNAAVGPFLGAALRGADITAGHDADWNLDTSLLRELRAGTFQDWPNPRSRMVLFHYPMREATAGAADAMVDRSKFRNHGAYVGTPTSTTSIVWSAFNGNFIGSLKKCAIGALEDAAINLVAAGGSLHYQEIESGV